MNLFRALFLIIILLTSDILVSAQEVYVFSGTTDVALFAGAAVTGGISQRLRKKHKPMQEFDVLNLSKSDINRFDRSAVSHFSVMADLRSDIGFLSTIALAGVNAFFLPIESANENNPYLKQASLLGTMWLQTNLLNAFGTEIIKNLIKRPRPYTYNPNVDLELKLKGDARKSFLSGHTSITAANSFFVAHTFAAYYPESKYKPLVWTAAALMPAWVGMERFLAGKHFPSDIAAGYVLGASTAFLVHYLHFSAKKESPVLQKSNEQIIWIRYRHSI